MSTPTIAPEGEPPVTDGLEYPRVLEVLSIRRYKAGYEVRTERILTHPDDKPFRVKRAYNPNGDHIGESRWAYRLCNYRGIAPELADPKHTTCSIGFCEREHKWYGWSHRAMFGFGIGSHVQEGDCGFVEATPQELFDSVTVDDGDGYRWMEPENVELIEGGIKLRHKMTKHTREGPNGELLDWVPDGYDYQVIVCGRGEWTAKTLDDARQMACDFASSVS